MRVPRFVFVAGIVAVWVAQTIQPVSAQVSGATL